MKLKTLNVSLAAIMALAMLMTLAGCGFDHHDYGHDRGGDDHHDDHHDNDRHVQDR